MRNTTRVLAGVTLLTTVALGPLGLEHTAGTAEANESACLGGTLSSQGGAFMGAGPSARDVVFTVMLTTCGDVLPKVINEAVGPDY